MPSSPFRRLHSPGFDLHLTGTEIALRVREHLKVVVLASGVHRTDCRIQVIHIGLHQPVLFVGQLCAAATFKGLAFRVNAGGMPLAPLFKRAAEIFSRNNVLPLHFHRPLRVFICFKTRRQRDIFVSIKLRAAVGAKAKTAVNIFKDSKNISNG